MAGPRKVRIFRDQKKSPNWYVEWRDLQGRRHCESCGPERRDAETRAGAITAELRNARTASVRPREVPPLGTAGSIASSAEGGEPPEYPILQLRALLRCPQLDLPVELCIPLGPQVLESIRQLLSEAKQQEPP